MDKKDKSKSLWFQNILIMLGILLIVVALILLADIFHRRERTKASNDYLLNSREATDGNLVPSSRDSSLDREADRNRRRRWFKEQTQEPEYMDLSGWLSVPSLGIETPLFTKEDDYWYYTEHNRLGEKDAEGEAGILQGDRNIIVWDHSFLDGTRFHKLANWPDTNRPLRATLEFANGDIKHYQLAESSYLSGDEFFQWEFASTEHWHEYLTHVVGWSRSVKPENLLTVYTCHTHDAAIKSVLWFIEVESSTELGVES